MRLLQVETLTGGRARVDVDKVTHAVPQEEGTRLFLGAQHSTRWRSWRTCSPAGSGATTASRAARSAACAERRRRPLAA